MPVTMPHKEFLETRRFSALDGLRGISILLVFTAHPKYHEFWPMFHGSSGVTIFFVLSGFLITTLLLREEKTQGKIDLTGFFLRRLFRIYPVFIAVFLVYCVLIFVLGLQADRRSGFETNIPYFLLFFPEHSMFFNLSNVAIPFNGAWSVGIEEKFYLVWPILGFVILAGIRWARPYVLMALILLFSASSFLPEWGPVFAPYTHIALGSLVAVVLNSKRGFAFLSHAGRPRVIGAIVAATLALQFGTPEVLRSLYVVYGFVVAALVAGVVTARSSDTKFLSSRFLVYTGKLSYVLYLVHNFGLNAAEAIIPANLELFGSILATVLGISASYLAAAAINKFYEEPLRRFGVTLAERRRAKISSTASVEKI